MGWLRAHAWWGLLVMSLIVTMFGITDLTGGVSSDPGIPLGLIGRTLAELEAESAQAYRLLDLGVRAGGIHLIIIGTLQLAILVFAFRRDLRWAWWAMWTLPAWAAAVFVFYLAAGVAPGQAPPPPMISGPIFAALSAVILLVSAARFFGRRQPVSAG